MRGMAGMVSVPVALFRFGIAGLLLFGACGTARATSWHTDKTQDPFTNTENISVQATGDNGGGFLVQCYEGHFRFFVEAVEPLPPVPKPNDLDHMSA